MSSPGSIRVEALDLSVASNGEHRLARKIEQR
jgi:hypothetical protein